VETQFSAEMLPQYPGSNMRSAKKDNLADQRKTEMDVETIPVYEASSWNAGTLSCKLAVRRLVLRGINFVPGGMSWGGGEG
jgi:hypothetical protein